MNSLEERIIQLVIKRINGELTEEESLELQDWINLSDDNRRAIEEFSDENMLREKVSHLYQTRQKVWERLQNKIPFNKQAPVRRMMIRYAAAASIIVLLFSAGWYFLLKRSPASSPITAGKPVPRQPYDAAPGGDKAILTLSDGSVIVLDSAADGTLMREGQTQVVKSGQGQLTYKPDHPGPVNAVTTIYNMLSTPRGGQYQLRLPDGSKVWLNAVSSLRFPVVFAGNERIVQLAGEAYFEIEKDAGRPFTVQILAASTGKLKGTVEVTGTHFNINAYDDEELIKTTLLEGSVKVSAPAKETPTVLLPGQQAQIIKNRLSIIKNVDTEQAIAWKNGLFQLTSADIRTIMRQIARWYDVEVVYEGAVPEGHITGKVSRNMKLSNVLKVLELSGMHFRIEEKRIVVLAQ